MSKFVGLTIFIVFTCATLCSMLYRDNIAYREAYIRQNELIREYAHEIDVLEWTYERDKVLEQGRFSDRVYRPRQLTLTSYQHELSVGSMISTYKSWKDKQNQRG